MGHQFDTMVEHNDWTPCNKAAYLIAALNEPAAHILYDVPTGVMYEEVTVALENRYSDHHLDEAFHTQLKRRTQLVSEFLQEFVAIIDDLAYCAHVDLPKRNISREAAVAFADRVREPEIRCQLHLGRKKTLSEALELEVADTAAGTSLRVWQTMSRKFRKSQSPTVERRE
jgi:hypothetical protein